MCIFSRSPPNLPNEIILLLTSSWWIPSRQTWTHEAVPQGAQYTRSGVCRAYQRALTRRSICQDPGDHLPGQSLQVHRGLAGATPGQDWAQQHKRGVRHDRRDWWRHPATWGESMGEGLIGTSSLTGTLSLITRRRSIRTAPVVSTPWPGECST